MSWPHGWQALDEAVLRAARGTPTAAIPVFYVLTIVGGGWLLFLLLPLFYRRSTRGFATFVLLGVGVTSGVVDILKKVIQRARPCEALGWCPPIDVASPGGFSFPSGHAAGSFAFAGFVWIWSRSLKNRRAARILSVTAMVYAALVGWSRVVLGVHYPTDVLGGAVLGFVLGAGFALVLQRIKARRDEEDRKIV